MLLARLSGGAAVLSFLLMGGWYTILRRSTHTHTYTNKKESERDYTFSHIDPPPPKIPPTMLSQIPRSNRREDNTSFMMQPQGLATWLVVHAGYVGIPVVWSSAGLISSRVWIDIRLSFLVLTAVACRSSGVERFTRCRASSVSVNVALIAS